MTDFIIDIIISDLVDDVDEICLECCICLDEIHIEDEIILKCNHIFHESCICNLLLYDNKCPLCKQYIRTNKKLIAKQSLLPLLHEPHRSTRGLRHFCLFAAACTIPALFSISLILMYAG